LFVAGQAHGYGVEVGPDNSVFHDGEWDRGVPVKEPRKVSFCEQSEILDCDLKVVENEEVVDVNGLRGRYRGILHAITGLPHGNGTLTYYPVSKNKEESLDFYEGCFDRGQYHGKGRIRWKSGDTYEGDYVMGKREGNGTYRWSDGRQYKGEFRNDMRHGEGVFIYGNRAGDWYQGSFVEGRREGKGRFVFSDGSKYDGDWKAGVYHGQGELVGSNGDVYVGSFENGVAHGHGKETNEDGVLKYEGNWVHGLTEAAAKKKLEAEKMLGQTPLQQLRNAANSINHNGTPSGAPVELDVYTPSKMRSSSSLFSPQLTQKAVQNAKPEFEAVVDREVQDADGHVGQYTGLISIETQKPNGVGRIVYMDGRRVHEGFWVDGKKEGHGRCMFAPQGDFHEGEYHNNVRHGPGQYRWKDGRMFEGLYVNDQRHGKGVFTYPNGDRYEGMFEDGDRSGFGRFEFSTGIYEGYWKSGRYHGKGKLERSGGDTLKGYFECGAFVRECDIDDEVHFNLDQGPSCNENPIDDGEIEHSENADDTKTTSSEDNEQTRVHVVQ